MSELMLDGKAHNVDLHPFRCTRFAGNGPIQSDFQFEVPADFGHEM